MNKKTLVFGASLKPSKYSNYVIKRLVNSGIEVVAFGINKGEAEGIEICSELIKYTNIHTVSLYLNPQKQKAYYDYIVSLNPKRILFNPGTENPEFYTILKKNNISFEAACSLVLLSTNQY